MKKLLFIFFLFLSGTIFAQSPITQNIGSDSTTVKSKGPLWALKGIITGSYDDTAAANLQHISQYPHALITVKDTLLVRDSTATKWLYVTSIASGSSYSLPFNGDSTSYLGGDSAFHNITLIISGGDTTIYQTIIDSTGQPGQPVLWARGNKIRSDTKLQYDSIHHKLGIDVNNISQGGTGTKLVVGNSGNALITGNTTSAKFITQGGNSSQFVKGDGSLDGNVYLKTSDTTGAFVTDVSSLNDSSFTVTKGATTTTITIHGTGGGSGGSSTIDTTVTASSNGQTNFVFSALPTRYIVMVNGLPFTDFTTSGGMTIIVGWSDIQIGDIIRLYQTQ